MTAPDDLEIRQYRTRDEASVVALWRRCDLVVPWNDPGADIRRKVALQPEMFLVGTVGAEVVATVMAGYEGHRGWSARVTFPTLRHIGRLGARRKGPELRRAMVAFALHSWPPMLAFAVGVWIGAALGACLMGALWAQDRRGTEGFTPALLPARVTRRRAAQLH